MSKAAQVSIEAAQPKLVLGDNIAQTKEFVHTGNADVGIIALSLDENDELISARLCN